MHEQTLNTPALAMAIQCCSTPIHIDENPYEHDAPSLSEVCNVILASKNAQATGRRVPKDLIHAVNIYTVGAEIIFTV